MTSGITGVESVVTRVGLLSILKGLCGDVTGSTPIILAFSTRCPGISPSLKGSFPKQVMVR